ncbi:sulfotransferase family protein [Azospirillum sp. Marseille-Q6669]
MAEATFFRPLFGTGLARSGGGLYTGTLGVHSRIHYAMCPFLQIYRHLRNAIVRQKVEEEFRFAVPETVPLQDYYFQPALRSVFLTIQNSNLSDIRFDDQGVGFLDAVRRRCALESPDIAKQVDGIGGDTYKNVFDSALKVIADVRGAAPGDWVGWHEPWTVEFFPLLARAYPDAHFIVMLRDPRAIINSNQAALTQEHLDPDEVGQVLSYARHWRKLVAFVERMRADPIFDGRLYVGTHDRLVSEPEPVLRSMCQFLDLEFDPRMLDTDNIVDYATGGTWRGNSSFDKVVTGFSAQTTDRWKSKLPTVILQATEFLCGPEMVRVGYEPVTPFATQPPSGDIVEYLVQSNSRYANWRTDIGDSVFDVGAEMFRRSLLGVGEAVCDDDLVDRCFLFREAYAALRALPGN